MVASESRSSGDKAVTRWIVRDQILSRKDPSFPPNFEPLVIFLLTDSVYCGKYYPFPQTSSQDFTLTHPTPSVAVQVAEPLQSNLSRTNLNASPIEEIQERRCKGSALNAMFKFILKDIIY